MNDSIVTARGLYKTFNGSPAVAGIDFDINKGECLGILGPNGAGKTTTLRMVLGLALPDSGTLQVLGYELPRQAREMRAKVGVVPQHDNLDPDFSVAENLYTYGSYFRLPREKIKNRVEELLKYAALEHKAKAKVTTLSGGMKRRLILARALINEPELLILDEPTTGLDPQARQLIWQRLHLLKEQGATLILTTHYMEEAQRLCTRILIMDQGKILAEGSPHQLISKNIERYVFEVHGEKLTEWEKKVQKLPGIRLERVGETLFCYTNDEQLLMQELQQWKTLEFIRRPGNLEDVFIKLTGRELRENA